MSPTPAALAGALVLLAALPALAAPRPPLDPAAVSDAREALRKEANVLDRIDALDRLIAELALTQFDLRERLAAPQARLKAIEENLGVLREQLVTRQTLVQQRLRARARLDEAAYVRILLGAHDPTEIVHRRVYLRRVLENDARLLRDLRQARLTLQSLTAEQHHTATALAADRAALDRQRALLESERRTRQAMLEALHQERDALRRLLGARDAAAAGLTFDGAAPPEARGFAAEKGRLRLPTAGRIVSRYGRHQDELLGTATFRKGVEIDALLGTPVRAVFGGRVAHSGWYKGFGNLVIVAHGEGYHTLYAHLASTPRKVGDLVAPGDVLGEVGDTGSLRGPLLYFEIRAQKMSLDPEDWLVRPVAGRRP